MIADFDDREYMETIKRLKKENAELQAKLDKQIAVVEGRILLKLVASGKVELKSRDSIGTILMDRYFGKNINIYIQEVKE